MYRFVCVWCVFLRFSSSSVAAVADYMLTVFLALVLCCLLRVFLS